METGIPRRKDKAGDGKPEKLYKKPEKKSVL